MDSVMAHTQCEIILLPALGREGLFQHHRPTWAWVATQNKSTWKAQMKTIQCGLAGRHGIKRHGCCQISDHAHRCFGSQQPPCGSRHLEKGGQPNTGQGLSAAPPSHAHTHKDTHTDTKMGVTSQTLGFLRQFDPGLFKSYSNNISLYFAFGWNLPLDIFQGGSGLLFVGKSFSQIHML